MQTVTISSDVICIMLTLFYDYFQHNDYLKKTALYHTHIIPHSTCAYVLQLLYT